MPSGATGPTGPGRRAELIERLGIVFWECDPDRRAFEYVSPGVAQVLGVAQEQLYEDSGLWLERVHPDDRDAVQEFDRATVAGSGDYDIEYRVFDATGAVRWVRDVVTSNADETGTVVRLCGITADVTERVDLTHRLLRAAGEFETVFGLLKGLYFRLGPDEIVLGSSATIAELLDRPLINIDGHHIDDVLPGPVADAVRRGIDAVSGDSRSAVEQVLTQSGSEQRLLEVSVFALGGDERVVVVQDIPERLAAQELEARHKAQLKALANEIERTADRERRRLAEEIHDRVSQTLAIARMRLVADSCDADDSEATRAEVLRLVEQAAAEARALTSELAPAGLYELGLSAALRALCEQLREAHGLECAIDDRLPRGIDIDQDTLAFVFRGARELLMNAVKHAWADRVDVRLAHDGEMLRVTVRDYGRGAVLDPESWQPGAEGGFGLYSVLERARTLGGDLDVQSVPGVGTIGVLTVPFEND